MFGASVAAKYTAQYAGRKIGMSRKASRRLGMFCKWVVVIATLDATGLVADLCIEGFAAAAQDHGGDVFSNRIAGAIVEDAQERAATRQLDLQDGMDTVRAAKNALHDLRTINKEPAATAAKPVQTYTAVDESIQQIRRDTAQKMHVGVAAQARLEEPAATAAKPVQTYTTGYIDDALRQRRHMAQEMQARLEAKYKGVAAQARWRKQGRRVVVALRATHLPSSATVTLPLFNLRFRIYFITAFITLLFILALFYLNHRHYLVTPISILFRSMPPVDMTSIL